MLTATAHHSANAPRTSAPVGRIFFNETKYELLKWGRTKPFLFATIGFPVMFYALFGLSNRRTVDGGVYIAKYMLGGYACFGLIGAALFGIGVGMAGDISAGWLELKRASPMPAAAYLFAKCVAAIGFGLIIVSILIVLGVTMGGVSISGSEVARMLGLSIVGSITFASMGLLLAQVVPANAAAGVVNLIYLPMSFLSGLFVPLRELPHWVRQAAPFMPTYHLAQLMVGIYGRGYVDSTSAATHWLGLVCFTLVMLAAGWAVFSRAERQA